MIKENQADGGRVRGRETTSSETEREKEKEKRPQIGGGPPDNVARGSTAAAACAAVPLVADLN